jgi:hypothetical protein
MTTQEKFDFLMSGDASLTEAEAKIRERIKGHIKEIEAMDWKKKKLQIATEDLIMFLVGIYDERNTPPQEIEQQ